MATIPLADTATPARIAIPDPAVTPAAEVAARFRVDVSTGLSGAEVEERRRIAFDRVGTFDPGRRDRRHARIAGRHRTLVHAAGGATSVPPLRRQRDCW